MSWFTMFQGRKRSLGIDEKAVYMEVYVDFREHLNKLKGAKLAVILAIALHSDEEGWAFPSWETLQRETGYSQSTIQRALTELCKMEVDGRRVLLRYQPDQEDERAKERPGKPKPGQFLSNYYLLFPDAENVKDYDSAGIYHKGAETGGGFKPADEPSCQNDTTADRHVKMTPTVMSNWHDKQSPWEVTPCNGSGDTWTDEEQETIKAMRIDLGHNNAEDRVREYGAEWCARCVAAVIDANMPERYRAGRLDKFITGKAPLPEPKPRHQPSGVICPNCWQHPCICDDE